MQCCRGNLTETIFTATLLCCLLQTSCSNESTQFERILTPTRTQVLCRVRIRHPDIGSIRGPTTKQFIYGRKGSLSMNLNPTSNTQKAYLSKGYPRKSQQGTTNRRFYRVQENPKPSSGHRASNPFLRGEKCMTGPRERREHGPNDRNTGFC